MEETRLIKTQKKYEINFLFAILCIYSIYIIINDYICFIFKSDAGIITFIASAVIVYIMVFFISKKVSFNIDKYNQYDVLFFIIAIGIYLIKFAIPDSSYDTLNYHIYAQEGAFSNNTLYNFFPGRWINTFLFPLGDRMHYFFRFILGYKLGNILNLFVLTVIYYQVKRILKIFIKSSKEMLIPIISLLVISTEFVFQNYITYYIDLIYIPFILEVLIIIFNRNYNYFNNLLVLFCAAVSISLKISNAFLLIPIGIIYAFEARKTITIKNIFLGVAVATFPIAIYLLNNYVQTRKSCIPVLQFNIPISLFG